MIPGSQAGEALHCIRARLTAGGCGTTEFCSPRSFSAPFYRISRLT